MRELKSVKILLFYFALITIVVFNSGLAHAGLLSTLMDVYEYETILHGDHGELLPAIVYQMTNVMDEYGITGVFIATNEAYNYSIGYINDTQHPAWDVVRLDILQGDSSIYAREWNGDRIYFDYLPEDLFSGYHFGYFYYEGEHTGDSQSLKIGETINGYVIGGALASPYVYTHDYNPQGSYSYVGYGETRYPTTPSTVPEPMTVLLFTSGIIAAARIKREGI